MAWQTTKLWWDPSIQPCIRKKSCHPPQQREQESKGICIFLLSPSTDEAEAPNKLNFYLNFMSGLWSIFYSLKNLHNPYDHDGVMTHLEPDILECEVNWALGSITMNKANGDNGISVELFQILKDDALKGLHSICQQIWKTHQWPQDWKSSVFIPIPKKRNAKECSNYHTVTPIS